MSQPVASPAIRIQEVVFDCHDVAAVASFWSRLMDTRMATVSDDWVIVDCGAVRLGFQPVPEAKATKNRVHLDLEVDDVEAARFYAESLGATLVRDGEEGEDGTGGVIMADVEGNEFCLVVDSRGTYLSRVKAALDRAE